MSTENSLLENDESVNKKAFSNGSKTVILKADYFQ
jgi:hypothetical protein